MPTLTVTNFSCIKSALLDLRPITILIGPQASGKSVLTKLFYFFSQIDESLYSAAEDGDTIRVLKRNVAEQFVEWFPPSAWGKQPFSIKYDAGPWSLEATRRESGKRVHDQVEFTFSTFIESHYETLRKQYRAATRTTKNEDDLSVRFISRTWEIRGASFRYLVQALGQELIGYQMFVPAGRAFFTNLQKTIAMFEYGSQLDEVTKGFGRLFTQMLDGEFFVPMPEKPAARSKEFFTRQKNELTSIFGGEIKLGRNDRHVTTPDGRKIPFSVLSSGQQELLPLLLALRFFARLASDQREKYTSLMYIEEPEAHLFPTSQGRLTSHLAGLSNFIAPSGKMFITTHSPYVLSKLNTLIKAHSVATLHSDLRDQVASIIPAQQWIAAANVGAYSLAQGKLSSIQHSSGLIDADYLDAISEEISLDFMRLLEIEASA
ncbi:MAG: AAA family ATPase [Sphingomicrobium sp.]